MSLDDALARAGQILADYKSPGAQDESGLALVWADQLAGVLRELADAASAWRAGLERPAVTVTGPVPVRSGDRGPGRVRGWLAAMPGAGLGGGGGGGGRGAVPAAAAAGSASRAGGPPRDGLGGVVRQLHEGAARGEEQASRRGAPSPALARQPATPGGGRSGWRRLL